MKELNPVVTVDQRELEEKLQELSELEGQLAQWELDLATLKAEMEAFEKRYLWIVGVRYAELDRLHAEITEVRAQDWPEDIRARAEASAARRRADASRRRAEAAQEPRTDEVFYGFPDLRDLYRELARLIHPDLAVEPEDRARRNAVMAEVNGAYAAGDAERLQTLLDEWKSRPDAIEGESPRDRLNRVVRMIDRARARLEAIPREIDRLMATDQYALVCKARFLEEEGRDLILEMAERLDKDIESTKKHLAKLRARQDLRRRRK